LIRELLRAIEAAFFGTERRSWGKGEIVNKERKNMEVETGERHFLSGEEQRRSRVQTIPLATSAPTGSRDHISENAENLKYMEVTNSILS